MEGSLDEPEGGVEWAVVATALKMVSPMMRISTLPPRASMTTSMVGIRWAARLGPGVD